MGVVHPPNQLPEAEPQLPLRDPLPAPFDDPLSEFASEPTSRRERVLQFEPTPREPLIEFDPDWRGPAESDRLTEPAFAPSASSSSRLAKGRLLLATVMLGVGLVAGFAGGVGFVTKYGGGQDASARSPASNRVEPETPRPVIQPPPPPVADQPAVIQGTAPATAAPASPIASDPQRAVETDAPRSVPRPPVREQGAPRERVETVPVASVTGLYVQSSPAGADVFLDEKLVSTTPFQLSEIAPGRYTIRIDMQGYRSWSMPVTIEQGVRTKISAVLER